jgi:hypothetical protein
LWYELFSNPRSTILNPQSSMSSPRHSLIRRIASRLDNFSRYAIGIPLRPYQQEVADAIVKSIVNRLGLSFVVIFPRQSGMFNPARLALIFPSNPPLPSLGLQPPERSGAGEGPGVRSGLRSDSSSPSRSTSYPEGISSPYGTSYPPKVPVGGRVSPQGGQLHCATLAPHCVPWHRPPGQVWCSAGVETRRSNLLPRLPHRPPSIVYRPGRVSG